MPAVRPERLRDDLVRLAHRGHDVRAFALGAARIVRRAVPFDGVCVLTLDPATILPTSEVVENGLPPEATPRMAEIEVAEDDFNKFTALARSDRRAASLSEVTGGELDRSLRHRDVRGPHGLGDELRAALVRDSTTWGGITLLRERGRANFAPAESQLLAAVAPQIAEGLRRALLQDAVSTEDTDQDGATGIVLLEDDNTIASANAAAREWLEELQGAPARDSVPDVVAAVAGRARSIAAGQALADARARARTRSGRWLLIHASTLGDEPGPRSVVILEPARPIELAPLIADAYGLTDRERMITQLVAQGADTNAIGERLHLSPWTVQDHLKSIFEKTGVGTRGELVARLFFEHYVPRLTSEG